MSDPKRAHPTTQSEQPPIKKQKVDPQGLSPNHLHHQENWATGDDPATKPQLGFIDALTSQHHLPALSDDEKANLGKSEASVMIDDLKNGKAGDQKPAEPTKSAKTKKESKVDDEKEEDSASEKEEDRVREEDGADNKNGAPKKGSVDEKKEEDQVIDGEEADEDTKEEVPDKKKDGSGPKEAAHTLENTTAAEPAPTDADPDSHLAHPENWATGDDPATAKQLGYLSVLAKQKGVSLPEDVQEGMGKSEASEKIDDLRHQ